MRTPSDTDEEDQRPSRFLQVLDHHLDAINYWRRSVYAESFAEGFATQAFDVLRGQTSLHSYLADRLDKAETIYLRSNISSQLWRMVQNYETEDEGLLPQDLPSDGGFVWLESPLYTTDIRGRSLSVRVIFWHKESNGVVLAFMSDATDMNDDMSRYLLDLHRGDLSKVTPVSSRIPLMHLVGWAWGMKIRAINPEQFVLDPNLDPSLADDSPPILQGDDRQKAVQSMIDMFNFVYSLWEFMGEQIPYRASPDRPRRRRLVREKSSLTEVLVVDLRPVKAPRGHSEDPQLVLWNHRWRVRPHKRRWIDKHGNYRETTVAGYVKGPEHLPLIEKDRVFNVRR